MALKTLGELPAHWLPEAPEGLVGWPLVGGQGEQLGTIEDVVVDIDRCQVLYLQVRTTGRSELVPVEGLRRDPAVKQVKVTFLAAEGPPPPTMDPYFQRIQEVLQTECLVQPSEAGMPPSPEAGASNEARDTYPSGMTSESPILEGDRPGRHQQAGVSPGSAEAEDHDWDHGPG